MDQLAHMIGSTLLLEDEAFAGMRDSENGFKRGLLLIVAISLVVGLVLSLVSFVGAVQTTPAQEVAQFQQGMREAIDQMRAMGAFGADEEFWRIFMQNFEAGIAMGRRIAGVVDRTTPAPQSVVDLFQALGRWVSYPFGWMSTWMLYGLITLVFAKLLGGTATIREMLAATSLFSVPHLLDAFSFIPYVGGLVGFVAFVWGLAIYVKGTAVANRLNMGRGLVAVIAPFVVLFVLVVLFGLLLVVLILVSG